MGLKSLFSKGKSTDGGDHWGEQRSVVDDDHSTERHWAKIDDRRYEAAIKLASDRKWLAIFFLLTTVAATGSAVYYAGRSEIQTQWVGYDKKAGDYAQINTIENPDVPAIVMQKEAERFIKCVFTRSLDPNVNNDCTVYVRLFIGTDKPSYERVAEWYKSVEGDGKLRLVTFVKRPTPASGSKYTYQAQWKMDVWDKTAGQLLESHLLEGEITFVWRQPTLNIFDVDKSGLFGRNFVFSAVEKPGGA